MTMTTEITLRNCQFAFRCKQKWEAMSPTSEDGLIRFCTDCMTEVFFCKNDQELLNHVQWNHCVAFERIIKDRKRVLLGEVIPQGNNS